MAKEVTNLDTSAARKRPKLKGEIISQGYEPLAEFARQRLNIHPTRLSRILCGVEFPSRPLQKKLCEELNLTPAELRRLL